MTDARPRHTLPRSVRVRSRKEFIHVLRQRHRLSNQWITLYVAGNDKGWTRLGISISKRVGGAVQRNRRKRLVREAFRQIRHDLPAGFDLIVMPHPGNEPSVADLQQSIRILTDRLVHGATFSRNPRSKNRHSKQ